MSVTKLANKSASLREHVSDAEWQARVDLAACYRLVALYGMTDLTATHISARVPDAPDCFLINPHGLFWEEITASSLIKVNHAGEILSDGEYGINRAGFIIHGAVHEARAEVNCVLHTHTVAGMAVSAMKEGLLPLTQHSMRFYNRLAYHDYEGIALDMDERSRLVADLNGHAAMILRNHGLLTAGRTVAEAFSLTFYLEKSCEAQVAAMSGGAALTLPSPEVCEHAASQFDEFGTREQDLDWPGHLRRLDALDPSYKQ